jgi:hypothetical protein
MCAFFCVCVQVEALRRADHPSKESYRLSSIKKLRKLSPILQKRKQAPKYGSNEEEKERMKTDTVVSISIETTLTFGDEYADWEKVNEHNFCHFV